MKINWPKELLQLNTKQILLEILVKMSYFQRQTDIIKESCFRRYTHSLLCQNQPYVVYTQTISHYVLRARLLNPPPAAQRHRHNLPSFREERQTHYSKCGQSNCGACEEDRITEHTPGFCISITLKQRRRRAAKGGLPRGR